MPSLFNHIKNDYAEIGVELEVLHHSELIADLIKEGKIQPEATIEEDITLS